MLVLVAGYAAQMIASRTQRRLVWALACASSLAGFAFASPAALAAAPGGGLVSTQTSETGSGAIGPGTTLGVTFNEPPVLAASYSLTLTDGTHTAQFSSAGSLTGKVSGDLITFTVGGAAPATLSRTNLEVLAASGVSDASGNPWNLIASGQTDKAYVLRAGDAVNVTYNEPVAVNSPYSLTLSEGTSTGIIGTAQGDIASVTGAGTRTLTFTLGGSPQLTSGTALAADGPQITAESGIGASPAGGPAPAITATTVTTTPASTCSTAGYTRVFGGTNCSIGFGNPGPTGPDVYDVIALPTVDLPGPPDDSAPEVVSNCAAGSTVTAYDLATGALLGSNACGNNPPEQLIGNTNSPTLVYVPTPKLASFEQVGLLETLPGSTYVSATVVPPQISAITVTANQATVSFFQPVACQNTNADSHTLGQFSYDAPASNLSATGLVYPTAIACPPSGGGTTITLTFAAAIPASSNAGGVRFKFEGYGPGHFIVGAAGSPSAYEREASQSAYVGPPAGTVFVTAPVNQTPPTISGVPRRGQTLTEAHGAWAGSPTAYAYQWQRCTSKGSDCAPVAGATAQTYRISKADVGARLRALETASNGAGAAAAAAASASTTVVKAAASAAGSGARPRTHVRSARVNSRGRTAVFVLRASGRARGFQCALVRRRGARFPRPHYARCSAHVSYRHLRLGSFRFYARAFGPGGVERVPVVINFRVRAH